MLRVTVVCCLLVGAFAFQAIAPLETKPEKFKNEEGCYISELDKVVPLWKSMPSTKSCIQYACDDKQVIISGCGAVAAVIPPLELDEDKNKPYPDCCPQIRHISKS